jgi:radical SAM protein with 4Fe4S-binding SPASM domain
MRIQTMELAGKNRVNLWEVYPLSQPWAMYIDVTNTCNFKCIYCPTGNPDMLQEVNRHRGHMPMELFVKLVKDLGELDEKLRVVNLYKDGEPLANPNFCKMVEIISNANVTDRLYSKTNGELISRHKDLAACNMHMLGISVPHVHEDKIQEIVGKKVNYQKYLDGIKRLFEDSRRKFTINTKIANYYLTEEDIEKFYNDFEPISDTVAIEGLHGWGAKEIKDTFLYDTGSHDGVPLVPKIACPLPIFMMSVNSDGTTGVCCAEWGHFHNLGNVYTEHVKDIFNNQKSKEFRRMHLEGRREENRACRDCQYRECLMDNIDEHRFEMLEKDK